MIYLLFSYVLCKHASQIKINEFNKTQYNSFRDHLGRNHFLITLTINNKSEKFPFYYDFFNNICHNISYYINENINFTYAILIDNAIKNDAVLLIYLPGMSETELDINTRMSALFNSNKILKTIKKNRFFLSLLMYR